MQVGRLEEANVLLRERILQLEQAVEMGRDRYEYAEDLGERATAALEELEQKYEREMGQLNALTQVGSPCLSLPGANGFREPFVMEVGEEEET